MASLKICFYLVIVTACSFKFAGASSQVAPVQSNFDHCKGATQAAAGGGKGACKCPDTTSSYLACNCTTEARSHNVSCFTKTNAWKCTVDGGSCTSAVESGCTLTGQVEICTKESKNNKDETEWKLGVLTADAINSQCGSLVTCTLPAKKPPAAAGNTDSTNEASTATTTSPKPTVPSAAMPSLKVNTLQLLIVVVAFYAGRILLGDN